MPNPPAPPEFDANIYAADPNAYVYLHERYAPGDVPWVSNSIWLGNNYQATPNQVNTVKVFPKKHPDVSPKPSPYKIDLFVARSSLVLDGINVRIPPDVIKKDTEIDPSGTEIAFSWMVGSDPSKADGPGHSCLIARCYPADVTPEATFKIYDPHIAQHNITILPVSSARVGSIRATPGTGRHVELPVVTSNVSRQKPSDVTIRVVVDQHPSSALLKHVSPMLQNVAGFRRLVTGNVVAENFAARTPQFHVLNQTDHSAISKFTPRIEFGHRQPGAAVRAAGPTHHEAMEPLAVDRLHLLNPHHETQLRLEPEQAGSFTFSASLAGAKVGDAQVFHLMQIGADGIIQGGLTVIPVVVD